MCCILISSTDGKPVEKSKTLLLTAVGRAENPDMIWNQDRTSVGRKWGKGPARVNGIAADLSLQAPVAAIYALDGAGNRLSQVEFHKQDTEASWHIGSEYQTLWYEIELE